MRKYEDDYYVYAFYVQGKLERIVRQDCWFQVPQTGTHGSVAGAGAAVITGFTNTTDDGSCLFNCFGTDDGGCIDTGTPPLNFGTISQPSSISIAKMAVRVCCPHNENRTLCERVDNLF